MNTIISKNSFVKILMTFFAAALILSSLFMFAACGSKGEDVSSSEDAPSTSSVSSEVQKITVTFKLIKDGKTEEFTMNTAEKYLADALVEEGLVEYANDGYYTTINGITADFARDKSWWCITVGGKDSMLGMNEIELKDGGSYEATYTIN